MLTTSDEGTPPVVFDDTINDACKPGYHGRFCTEVCRYPNYGPLCEEGCNCLKEHCHHITGCFNPALVVTHSTSEDQLLITETSEPTTVKSTRRNACKPGYHGRFCTEVCRYPNYGPLCEEGCNCLKEHCHHITGCFNPALVVTHSTSEDQLLITETSEPTTVKSTRRNACKPGYHGRFCTEVCRYPNYGPLCEEGCNCLKEHCHHITGCFNPALVVTHSTSEDQLLITETSEPTTVKSTRRNACKPGYHGRFCTEVCRYPNYGPLCEEGCNCLKEHCHHITGCFNPALVVTHSTSEDQLLITETSEPTTVKSTRRNGIYQMDLSFFHSLSLSVSFFLRVLIVQPGYHGRFCTEVCRYPNYGPLCEEGCNCLKEHCHHITGCFNPALVVTHSTSEDQLLITETSEPTTVKSTRRNACKPGYHGRFCTEVCRYPNYGPLCEEGCNCLKEHCHHITGCFNPALVVTHSTSEDQLLITETSEPTTVKSTRRNACKPGYHGRFCTEVCRYPNYGPLCEEGCNCLKEHCHHITGCFNPALVVTHSTSEDQLLITETSEPTTVKSTRRNACKPGYHGRFCTEVCRYPNYGPLCEEGCNCLKEHCHHITGCFNPALVVTHSTSEDQLLITETSEPTTVKSTRRNGIYQMDLSFFHSLSLSVSFFLRVLMLENILNFSSISLVRVVHIKNQQQRWVWRY
uniref:Multiple epidermal growth factor-like domains protein 10 n=1 Tax=Crassostrea virginica TaxID=6565 RepID=A0A8B8AVP2_CRAVI|nr:multiple epidermal growth factor-like domains protein 10 [Crassostrea virginica]